MWKPFCKLVHEAKFSSVKPVFRLKREIQIMKPIFQRQNKLSVYFEEIHVFIQLTASS